MDKRVGGCRCGAVRYVVTGEPTIIGICHCTDCRRESGAAYLYYADWPIGRFSMTGAVASFDGRSYCPDCGAPVFHLNERRAEIVLGSLDLAPTGLVPQVEGWIKRREPWLSPVPGARQFDEDID